jgi:DivIVA domain-containing protein
VESLSQRIESVKFRLGLKGYNVDEVDRFLANLSHRIDNGDAITANELDHPQFRRSLKGYNIDEVDGFVRDIASSLGSG